MERIKKENALQKISLIGKYLIFLVLFYVLYNVRIASLDINFAPALLFALMWCNQKPYILVPLYMVSAVLTSFALANILSAVCTIFVLMFVYYLHILIKKSMNIGLICFYYLVSQFAYLFQSFSTGFLNYQPYICIISTILFLFCAINFLQVLFARGLFYRFTLDESICLFIFVALVGSGLVSFDLVYLSAYRIVALTGALFLICINKQYLAVIFALSIGLGVAVNVQSLLPVAELVVLVLSASIFRYPYRYLMSISLVLVNLVLVFVFKGDFWSLSNGVIASVIINALPSQMIESVCDKWQMSMTDMASRNIVATTRKSIRRRMQNLSNVFFDMERLYKGLVKGELSREQVRDMLYNELVQNCCTDCLEKPKCLRSGLQQDLENLIEIGLDKGRVSILDLPTSLSSKCARSNAIVNKINQILSQYSNYNSITSSVDNAKLLLSQTLGGVSKLILNLGDEIDKNINFDSKNEAKIQDRLLAKNIICTEILLYREKNNQMSATLIVKGEQAYNPIIEKVVSEVCACQMKIGDVVASERAGWMVVSLEQVNKFDLVFGLASCKKNGSVASGDCHSLLRLGGNKYLIALCDGMGSGQKAEAQSAMTIGLIENFYRAGFDNELALSNVNKLLAVNNQETYSALDICIMDLELGSVDIIKVGSPFGAIRRADRIDIVEGGALPIGVLEHTSPKYYKTTIATTDFLIMMTDGVTDAFDNQDNFTDYIATLETLNPQELAERILGEAVRRNDSIAKDDMTVLVARTYQKY